MRLGKRTAKIVREAIVLAHVHDARWGQAHDRLDEYPLDSEVVELVLASAVGASDIYPTLSKLEEAHEAKTARTKRFTAFLAASMNNRKAADR